MKQRAQWIAVTALGIALFVVFSIALRIPVFQRFYLCLGYVVMGIYCYYFGILSGTLVGVVGVLFYCTIFSSFGGMIGWALGNIVIGVAVGSVCKMTRKIRSEWIRMIPIIITAIVSTAVGMLLIKSFYESILSGLPFSVRFYANLPAFFADAAVLAISFPIAKSLHKIITRQFPLLIA